MDEYISREAVVRYLKGYSEKELNSRGNFGMITSSVLDKAERAISELPTADVQPVKHGQWINLTPMGQRAKQRMTWHGCVAWMCSECHGGARFFSEDLPYELCPHCGAIMTFGGDGEEQCAHTEYMERVAKELASEDGGSDD